MGNDTQKGPHIFIAGATVAVQQEDGRTLTHDVIAESSNDDHTGDVPILYE